MKKTENFIKTVSNKNEKRRRIIAIFSLCIVIILFCLASFFVYNAFKNHCSSTEEFKEYIDSFGIYGWLVAVGVQALQVIIALIPGEVIELGMGYVFGFWEGTALCLLGCIIGSTIVFLLVKKFGIKLLRLIFDIDKINELKFLKNEKRVNYFIFLIFFIPGTPKDLVTYFVGLTKTRLTTFLVISTIARIPSVITSTVVGNLVGGDKYIIAIIIYAVVGILSLVGIKLYNKFSKAENEKEFRRQLRKEKRKRLLQTAKLKTKPKLGKIKKLKEKVKMKTKSIRVKYRGKRDNQEKIYCTETVNNQKTNNN